MTLKSSGLALLLLGWGAFPLRAQQLPDTTAGWNSPRALRLVAEARRRREEPRADTTLFDYQSHADGYVYFYLDRAGSDEKTLVRVDQLALDVYWKAPHLTKQRIVGRRDASKLPNQMYYHLDHLTVVQDEFGDVIRVGDGDEVRSVPHPAGPGADSIYEYRIADSLSLHLPGTPEPVRVYELAVRPRRVDRPAFIGSLYVDQSTGAIVRMTFTFTPASYVDRRLDYIDISLENALWQGRWWLPHEQRVEIRRQLPELDFPAGAVIRGVFRIGDYRFNQALPLALFASPRVVAAPPEMLRRYPFPEGLYADLNQEGLAPSPDMATLRARAAALVRQHYLSGLPRLRLHLGGASSALRYDRAEGVFLGGGMAYTPADRLALTGNVGYALGARHLSLDAAARLRLGTASALRLDGFRLGLRDIGDGPALSGALNTVSAAFFGSDYLDPYYATGARLSLEHALGPRWAISIGVGAEHDRSATLAEDNAALNGAVSFRPVRPVGEGRLISGSMALTRSQDRTGDRGWGGRAVLDGGALGDVGFARPAVHGWLDLGSADHRTSLRITGAAGAAVGALPPQRLFLLGGPGTLPGYAYRGFAGDRFALADLEAARTVAGPWLRLRALGGLGWSELANSTLPGGWDARPTGGVRPYLGAGVGIVYDILHVDLARGLRDGRWQLLLGVSRTLKDIL